MNIKPILFSGPMVQAILEGRKTMTRRVVKPQPQYYNENSFISTCNFKNGNFCLKHKMPGSPERFEITDLMKSKYEIGDILWVRETWAQFDYPEKAPFHYAYKSDGFIQRYGAWERDTPNKLHDVERIERWKPSIHMPKAAARIFLKVNGVKVERLQDISEADAIAEGIVIHKPVPGDGQTIYKNYCGSADRLPYWINPILSFKSLWQSINGDQSWDANPFVFAYTFDRIDKPEGWPL